MLGIRKAAEHFGVTAAAWKIAPEDLANTPRPFIALLDESHFVVVTEVTTNNELILLDPAMGRLKYPAVVFLRQWAGQAVLFGEKATPAVSRSHPVSNR